MPCDALPAQCLAWHIQPKLAGVQTVNGDRTIRARCPACGNHRGLTISPGDNARIMWNCFACGDQAAIRHALIQAGVPPGCVPRPRNTEAEIIAAAMQVLREDTDSSARLRAYLILSGHRHWPKGAELERLAAEIGVSRSRAFLAKQAGGLLPGASVPTRPVQRLSRAAGQAP
jgi:hypothetical protein